MHQVLRQFFVIKVGFIINVLGSGLLLDSNTFIVEVFLFNPVQLRTGAIIHRGPVKFPALPVLSKNLRQRGLFKIDDAIAVFVPVCQLIDILDP